MTLVIGLDQSLTNTGFVVLGGEGIVEQGVFSPDVTDITRLDAIYKFIKELVKRHAPVDALAIEGYSLGSKYGREAMGEVGGIAKLVAVQELRVKRVKRFYVIQIHMAKKFACGKGNAKKMEAAVSAVRKWSELDGIDNEHVIDAFIIAKIIYEKELSISKPVDQDKRILTAYEQKVLEDITSLNGEGQRQRGRKK